MAHRPGGPRLGAIALERGVLNPLDGSLSLALHRFLQCFDNASRAGENAVHQNGAIRILAREDRIKGNRTTFVAQGSQELFDFGSRLSLVCSQNGDPMFVDEIDRFFLVQSQLLV